VTAVAITYRRACNGSRFGRAWGRAQTGRLVLGRHTAPAPAPIDALDLRGCAAMTSVARGNRSAQCTCSAVAPVVEVGVRPVPSRPITALDQRGRLLLYRPLAPIGSKERWNGSRFQKLKVFHRAILMLVLRPISTRFGSRAVHMLQAGSRLVTAVFLRICTVVLASPPHADDPPSICTSRRNRYRTSENSHQSHRFVHQIWCPEPPLLRGNKPIASPWRTTISYGRLPCGLGIGPDRRKVVSPPGNPPIDAIDNRAPARRLHHQ